MLPIRTILFPTDFSERSRCALPLACALARDYDAKLLVVHVSVPPVLVYSEGIIPVDPLNDKERAKEMLERMEIHAPEVRIEPPIVGRRPRFRDPEGGTRGPVRVHCDGHARLDRRGPVPDGQCRRADRSQGTVPRPDGEGAVPWYRAG